MRLSTPAYKYYASAEKRAEGKRHNYARRTARIFPGTWAPHDEKRGPQKARYYVDTWPDGWRDLGDVHDICRKHADISSRLIDHTGWYADPYQDALMRGRVLQLPARNGEPKYIPGAYCTEWDDVTLFPREITSSLRDAVMRADEWAETLAEESREYYAKEDAERQIEEKRDEIKAARRECLLLLRSRKQMAAPWPVTKAVRERVCAYVQQIKEARERIAALQDNFWLAVDGA